MTRLSMLVFAAIVASCGGGRSGPPPVSPAMVSRAQQSWPEASKQALDEGRSTFVAKCRQCHALPKPSARSPEQWPAQVEKMGKLAGLNSEQKKRVLHYLLAAQGE